VLGLGTSQADPVALFCVVGFLVLVGIRGQRGDRPGGIHNLLQLVVVDRLAAVPGSDAWGRLSVMVQYQCKVEKLFKVPPGAFQPQPKVDSAIVRLTPQRPLPCAASDPQLFERVVREAFSQRRKTLRNTLRHLVEPAQFEQLGIDPSRRAETLALADYVSIANLLAAGSKSS
ncbi:MAG: ribosomal RNA small subunit methyltransferase A, partial [Pseudohongiellaceae bacterium]